MLLEKVEPFYSESAAFDSSMLLGMGAIIASIMLLGIALGLFMEGWKYAAPLPLLLGLVAATVGSFSLVGHSESEAKDEARFLAWAKDSYGLELDPADPYRMEMGFAIPLDDGKSVYLEEQKDGGVLLYQRVDNPVIRSTYEPVPPVAQDGE